MVYPNVDTWERDVPEDAYVLSDGSNIRLNIKRVIPNSTRRFNDSDRDSIISLETYIIERGLFVKKINVLCKYIDYFIEYFDEDKELPIVFMYMKNKLDSVSESLTITEFLELMNRKFFRDTHIKKNIYKMVDANYNLDVTVDQKTGRLFVGPDDFTNEDAKRLLAVSMFMKFIIPIASQYISTNTLYDDDTLDTLMIKVFVESFYQIADINRGDEYDPEDLMIKLYRFCEKKIKKHFKQHDPLVQHQTALRGLTQDDHIDTILIRHLIGNNMFKFQFDENIISFMKSIVDTQLICTINKLKYKVNPVLVSSTKDVNGLSGIDKLEQIMAKCDETQVIRCEKSLEWVLRDLEKEYGEISNDEIDYYMHHFIATSDYHKMLIDYCFANRFGGFTELKHMGVYNYIRLMIYAKRKYTLMGFKELPYLLSSVLKGRMSQRVLQNTKFLNKYSSSSTYEAQMMNKYPVLLGFRENEPLKIISKALTNIFTYVEYENQELTGEDIEFNEDIITDEIQNMIDMI